jgi:glycerophosphoryl diester phosphodiesterase
MRLLPYTILVACLVSCSSSKQTWKNKMAFADNCVVAHRGAWKLNDFPQNSIASLKQAIKLKCAGSEFDVRMTADDSLVIIHDPKFNELEIEKTMYSDLFRYKLANGEALPTLRQYLLAGLDNNQSTRLVCEIKPSDISKERGKLIATRVINLVKEFRAQKYMVYISFDYDILKRILEIDPNAATQYLDGDKSPEQLKADGISGADFHYSVYQDHPDLIGLARKN